MSEKLPIESLRPDLLEALGAGPAVVSSPTGSGKSTQVPRWCPGRVLVVEPRRVACRSLAQRVAELEGVRLGQEVGYHVRDEQRCGQATRILFATTGVALRIFDSLAGYETVILDEFHERSLDVDLLLALLLRRYRGRLVVMSATLEGERLASHLGGRHLHAEGRSYPVAVRHLDAGVLLPEVRGLEDRVRRAVEVCREQRIPGDVLVFLPGKAEIASCARRLAGERELEVLELHGGLTLEQQSRAFLPAPAARRKVVLATNVAETSITLPGIGVVIDSGLVRQTRYFRDRGFLTLVPIAGDSAEQRCGRAGRTAEGVCFRLWSAAAQLERRTRPEVHRESLVPLVLAAAACGERVDGLSFFDPPKEHAAAIAREELLRLQALDGDGHITDSGRQLFGLPLDVPLSRLLVEALAAEERSPGVLDDVIDLVSVLAVGRPLFTRQSPAQDDPGGPDPGGPDPGGPDPEQESPASGCDATALIRALRGKPPGPDRRHPFTLREARAARTRLRRTYGRSSDPRDAAVDRKRLAMTVLAADPRSAHVARRRGRRVAWSNGGTEVELGRESAVRRLENVEAIAVLDSRAVGLGGRDTRMLVTCAMPLPLDWLVEAGLGRDRLAQPVVDGGRAVARIERVYARRVLTVREEVPAGELARQAVARLFLMGEIFPDTLGTTRERLQAAALAARLAARGDTPWRDEIVPLYGETVPELEDWVTARLARLGVESGEDLALLSAGDLLAPDLPPAIRQELDRQFPRALKLPGAAYEIAYDLKRREVTLHQVKGRRTEVPPLSYLPPLFGFRILLEHKGTLRTLRERT